MDNDGSEELVLADRLAGTYTFDVRFISGKSTLGFSNMVTGLSCD